MPPFIILGHVKPRKTEEIISEKHAQMTAVVS